MPNARKLVEKEDRTMEGLSRFGIKPSMRALTVDNEDHGSYSRIHSRKKDNTFYWSTTVCSSAHTCRIWKSFQKSCDKLGCYKQRIYSIKDGQVIQLIAPVLTVSKGFVFQVDPYSQLPEIWSFVCLLFFRC